MLVHHHLLLLSCSVMDLLDDGQRGGRSIDLLELLLETPQDALPPQSKLNSLLSSASSGYMKSSKDGHNSTADENGNPGADGHGHGNGNSNRNSADGGGSNNSSDVNNSNGNYGDGVVVAMSAKEDRSENAPLSTVFMRRLKLTVAPLCSV
jgi:hypothetical protein